MTTEPLSEDAALSAFVAGTDEVPDSATIHMMWDDWDGGSGEDTPLTLGHLRALSARLSARPAGADDTISPCQLRGAADAVERPSEMQPMDWQALPRVLRGAADALDAAAAERDAAAADRDALLHALGFKPGPLDRGALTRKVILDDAGGLRDEMVKARPRRQPGRWGGRWRQWGGVSMAQTPQRIIEKLRPAREGGPERTSADQAYLLWQTAMRAHGAEWAWQRMGIRPAATREEA